MENSEHPNDNAIVRDCPDCSGLGFHLSPYAGPDKPRTKTDCVPCNGFGIKIIRRTAVNHDVASGGSRG